MICVLQCLCSWEGRDQMFTEVEAIIRRQIDVRINFLSMLSFSHYQLCWLLNVNAIFLFQMSLLPSVQPFHAIAYPIDPMLALEIR